MPTDSNSTEDAREELRSSSQQRVGRCREQEPSTAEASEAAGGGEREEKLHKPRKRQHCRLCGQHIAPGEPCRSWSGVEPGEGWWRSYAHPECYAQTEKEKWDYGDWESCYPGDMERPKVAEAAAGGRDSASEHSGAQAPTSVLSNPPLDNP